MIIQTHFKNQQVLLNVPTGNLVFDGSTFLPPEEAKYVQLVQQSDVANFSFPRTDYPEQSALSNPIPLELFTGFLCKVIQITSQDDATPDDILNVADPTGGVCICGVTCQGNKIVLVPVTNL